MMDIDLGHLRALAAIVDEGSFESAAVALHVTPSAVSQRIKQLERSAGQVLVRRTRPAEATDAGQAYVRLARQIDALVFDAKAAATAGAAGAKPMANVPLAINADSLATWVMPALAELAHAICFEIHQDDQDYSAALLRAGTVMAAITSDSDAVQGCSVTRLGVMRYRPMASPAFGETWFPDGVTPAALSQAPMVVFGRKDDLQDRYLRKRSRRRLTPPRHHIPASVAFADAVRSGFGWGLLPDQQSKTLEATGALVDIDRGYHVDVTLYWQQWRLETPALDSAARAIQAAARRQLR